jgi:hypothetical protein
MKEIAMKDRLITKYFKFRKTAGNGLLAGKTYKQDVPAWSWEAFASNPLAEEFARQCYEKALHTLVRENLLREAKHNIDSIEIVLRESLSVKEGDILDWIDFNESSIRNSVKKADAGISILKEYLPPLAHSDNPGLSEAIRERLAEIIADSVASQADPVGEFLWAKLSQPVTHSDLDMYL